ncbi:MAG: hypothetical protein ACFFKA_10700, partial [Candidatus Thorarchaeota archaeon]
LLNERLEVIPDSSQLSEEDLFVYKREKELFEKCAASLNATNELKERIEKIFTQLEEQGITQKDLIKISELTLEYNINIYQVISETFGNDQKAKNTFNDILKKIENTFNEYYKWKEVELKIF